MLKSLNLHNFIIIDHLEINFHRGYSVFTGETGSGKSIILEALLLTVGGKASPDLIKEGKDKASIIANYVINDTIIAVLAQHEINVEDGELIIRRIINKNGSSKAYINDIPVSLNLLKNLSYRLLDMHGQFDNQMLLNPNSYISLLDKFIPHQLLDNVSKDYKSYKSALTEYNQLLTEVKHLNSEQQYLTYVLEELERADVKENEELELVEQRALCLEQDKITDTLGEVANIFREEDSVLNKVSQALRALARVKLLLSNNEIYDSIVAKLEQSYTELLDSEALVMELLQAFDHQDLDINTIEERLTVIRTLSKKHKVPSAELAMITNTLRIKLNTLQTSEANLQTQRQNLDNTKNQFINSATLLSIARQEMSHQLSLRVNQELQDLHLKGVELQVIVTESKDDETSYNPLGFNQVSFKFINNLSTEPKDLNKIASGGELSRVMLALKVVLAEKTAPLINIFDEIDIGVGGEVAHSIGNKINYLAEFSQVIAITHSHQVAAIAQYHYKVSKTLENNINTHVQLLSFEDRVLEIARMLSANKITSDAKSIAYSLLKIN